jgi:hypothetical protein
MRHLLRVNASFALAMPLDFGLLEQQIDAF